MAGANDDEKKLYRLIWQRSVGRVSSHHHLLLRTDSTSLSKFALAGIAKAVESNYGASAGLGALAVHAASSLSSVAVGAAVCR